MGSNWFDIEDEIASEFFEKSRIDRARKNENFGIGTNRKRNILITENYMRTNEVNDTLNSTSSKYDLNQEKNKLLDSLLRNPKNYGRNSMGHSSQFSDAISEEFFSDAVTKISKIKNQFCDGGRYKTENLKTYDYKEKKEMKAPYSDEFGSGGSASNYAFSEVYANEPARSRKDSVDSSWSRKSCQPNVSFPSSSASTISEAYGGCSAKSIDRSISRDSDDSTCTEKTINSSTVSEKLADGTDKVQFENNESWLKKSTSGSTIVEKKVNDMTTKEKKDDETCEQSSTKMSYSEKSASGSSLQEEIMSQRITSSGKDGVKTVEQKTSSETIKKTHFNKAAPSHSVYYDDLGSHSFEQPAPTSFSKVPGDDLKDTIPIRAKREPFSTAGTSSRISEKLSKLIDEAVYQDTMFDISSPLQKNLDKMTDDFFNLKSFEKDKTVTRGRRMTDSFSKSDKEELHTVRSNITRLKSENDSLQQENLKLHSIIQDVTAVNKRWQKYNNERRLYVQKLLSTIQDLQEQINLISEKSAFQSKSMSEEVNSQLDEIKKLKKEHQEHVAVLELQMKTHLDDREAERKERKKAVKERHETENKMLELTRDVEYLKQLLEEERQRKTNVCVICESKLKDEVFQQRMDYSRQEPSIDVSNYSKTSYYTPAPYSFKAASTQSDEGYREGILDNHLINPESDAFNTAQRENFQKTFLNESFNRSAQIGKTLKSDTVVVADERGIRLAITEQFPTKNTNSKSTLKKKSKSGSNKSYSKQETKEQYKSVKSRLTCTNNPNITCEECNLEEANNFGVSIGFQSEGLSQIISIVPNFGENNNDMHYLSIGVSPLNTGGKINRSRSVPNTRSNSTENLKPLRESSSWNNQFSGAENNLQDNVSCVDCERMYSSSMPSRHFDHFEINQSEKNQF